MHSSRRPRTTRLRILVLVAVLGLAIASPAAAATATVRATARAASDSAQPYPVWQWPLDGPRDIAAPYRAPVHEYAAGHRGLDLTAAVGVVVRAPAPGVVAFRGVVVDRRLLTIEHPGGFVSTFEPLTSDLSPGDAVSTGDAIGTVDLGGHASAGTLHFGVRLDGDYLNPLLLFGPVPRAVLLPCCAPV